MLIRSTTALNPARITPSEITSPTHYAQRRSFVASLGRAAFVTTAVSGASGLLLPASTALAQGKAEKLAGKPSSFSTIEKQTPYHDVTTYNNFYEFGTDKADPAVNARAFKTRPWSVAVEGAVAKPRGFSLDELLKLAPLEERVYRMRCVEGWSMVIPWVGYSLMALIKAVEPTGNAKFVEFITLADEKQMPDLRTPVLRWPYTEGLRMDEAMHPLTLLGLGWYGEVLPHQNGAPVRLVVPWKYGFKSGKSLVKIRFTETMPKTSWNLAAANEYGFYSNVNPDVSHPRWSQATERRIGDDGFLQKKRKTELFNGYSAQVAALYAGMDLKKNF